MSETASGTSAIEIELGSGVAAIIDYRWFPSAAHGSEPPVVLLHEGLGSIAQWRNLPHDLATALGRPVLAYNRPGYGTSTIVDQHRTPLLPPFRPDFMEREAVDVLPPLLAALSVESCDLVGHSDGGTIALIAAATKAVTCRRLVTIAAHTHVEPVCIAGIRSADAQRERIEAGLARYHTDPALTFGRWRDIWLDPAFADWSIVDQLASIECPTLAIQGADDEYATDAMLTGIGRAIGATCDTVLLPDCGHIAHRDQPTVLLQTIVDFL